MTPKALSREIKFRAELMSYQDDCGYSDPSKGGFNTEGEAFEYIKQQCPLHKESDDEDLKLGYCTYCEAEWFIVEDY